MPLLSLLLALLPGATPSFFLGGQLASRSYWGNAAELVGGVRVGEWDGWLAVAPAWEAYERPDDTLFGNERGTYAWWATSFRGGGEWCSRDSGVGQTLGAQLQFLEMDSYGITSPMRRSTLDLLWGIRWLGGGLEADATFGPSLTWIRNEAFDWRISLNPCLNLRVAKIW